MRAIKQRLIGAHNLELHPNGKAFFVVIFDLGLGEGRFFDGRPHHRFGALIKRAVHQELHELFSDYTLGMEIHGKIRLRPVACDAHALELVALDVDPPGSEIAAFGPEFVDWHLILVTALFAVLLFDLPFDRQPVAIPPRNVACVKAHHLVAAHDHILDRFIQRVPDVQMPVGIGRAIMQRERGAPRFFAQTVIDADVFPPGQPLRLAFRQACAHREISARQVQGLFIFGGLGAHGGRPSGR